MVQVEKSAGDGYVPGSASKPAFPQRAGALAIGSLIDLYMAHYEGRDPTRVQRLGWWSKRIGHLELQALSDDDVHAALAALTLPTLGTCAPPETV